MLCAILRNTWPKSFVLVTPTRKSIRFYRGMIEFQGEQHYGIANKAITHGSRKWQSQKKRDNHLRRYASDHNVRLIEVPYTYRSNVDTFLAEQGIA